MTLLNTLTGGGGGGEELDPVRALELVGRLAEGLGQAGGYPAMLGCVRGADGRVAGVATQLVATLAGLGLDDVRARALGRSSRAGAAERERVAAAAAAEMRFSPHPREGLHALFPASPSPTSPSAAC